MTRSTNIFGITQRSWLCTCRIRKRRELGHHHGQPPSVPMRSKTLTKEEAHVPILEAVRKGGQCIGRPAAETCELMGALYPARRPSLSNEHLGFNDALEFQAANRVLQETWTVTVEKPQHSFPSLRMASERNSARCRSPWDLPDPKPATVRALTSALWTKPESHCVPFLQFLNSQMNSSFPFYLTSHQTRGSPVPLRGFTPNTI